MHLLTDAEFKQKYSLDDKELSTHLVEGIPHFKLGKSLRFIEKEVDYWMKAGERRQDLLESAFLDDKGRTIKDYVTLETVASTLRLSKTNIESLAKKGMPFVRIGNKDFYQMDDILDYSREGTPIPECLYKEIEKDTAKQSSKSITLKKQITPQHFIAVDGSYSKNHKIASGVVWQSPERTNGYAHSYTYTTKGSIISEWQAILDGLKLIDKEKIENAVILTDQKQYIDHLNKKGAIELSKKLKKEKVNIEIIGELNKLLKKLKGRVVFRYANISPYKPIYKQAHKYSKLHQNKTFKDIAIAYKIQQPTITKVKYVGEKDKKPTFEVLIDGKQRRYNGAEGSLLKSMFIILRNLTSQRDNLHLTIESLPKFNNECQSEKEINWIKKMYGKVEEKCVEIQMEKHFAKYLNQLTTGG